ncbi:MAG: hypothetical protein JXA71_09860 [Chitinispirillaceae bacterium]|nr:hypothetical protein [Chitinispirillaceae bacterium]
MLKRVSPDSVEAFQRKLCSFHTRHVLSTCSRDEVIPWMKQMYKKYGCDTIISLSLGSGNSDEIIGVRRGKKDSSIKKFVLLGGHTDNIISGTDPNTRHHTLSQPTTITTTTSNSISSDPRNHWANGFACIGHNFAMAGAGRIHTADDVITSSYDKAFQAECAKLGIITTADYAEVITTKSDAAKTLSRSSPLRCVQTGKQALFTLRDNRKPEPGEIRIFDLHGKLVRTFATDKSATSVIWDGKKSDGMPVASHTVMLVHYSSPSANSTVKLVMK